MNELKRKLNFRREEETSFTIKILEEGDIMMIRLFQAATCRADLLEFPTCEQDYKWTHVNMLVRSRVCV